MNPSETIEDLRAIGVPSDQILMLDLRPIGELLNGHDRDVIQRATSDSLIHSVGDVVVLRAGTNRGGRHLALVQSQAEPGRLMLVRIHDRSNARHLRQDPQIDVELFNHSSASWGSDLVGHTGEIYYHRGVFYLAIATPLNAIDQLIRIRAQWQARTPVPFPMAKAI